MFEMPDTTDTLNISYFDLLLEVDEVERFSTKPYDKSDGNLISSLSTILSDIETFQHEKFLAWRLAQT